MSFGDTHTGTKITNQMGVCWPNYTIILMVMYDRNNVVKNTQSRSRKGLTFRAKNCGILFRLLNLVAESRKLGTFTCAAALRLGMAMGRVGCLDT